ncbi:PEP-CTERM sorting domain-containing protein [Aeoliella sp. SH292]|uniref:PEP-CTERM sorting domain-containing protein n=1 Tax=Aeoliella sp. SH292 TaxID=3454464 RepID=UPI003F952369
MVRSDSCRQLPFRPTSLVRLCGAGILVGLSALATCGDVRSQVLVADPYVTGFEGWTDTFTGPPESGAAPNWGVLLTGPRTLIESSDGIADSGTTTSGVANGAYTPYIMVNSTDTTPATYVLSSQLGTYDDDGFGLVFGYQDNLNYFRVGFRNQTNSNLGFGVGTSVQKVVNGTITQLATNPAATFPDATGVLSNVEVDVDGTNWAVRLNGAPILNGTDADLAPGKYGVHSWAQREAGAGDRYWGTSVESVSVASTTLNKTTTFSDAITNNWRFMTMTNAAGAQGVSVDDFGNFRQDFRNGTITDDSNGFTYATTSAPNVDFIGPAVVIDEPGSTSWSDYRMTTRVQNGDDDGVGVVFRVANDNTFYRVNFSREVIGADHERAPRGMSIQKNDNGSWSELFRDDQASPKFLFGDDVPFDLSVTVIGDTIKVDVVNDPDGAANAISYAPVVDTFNPILAGSVGFTNWGSGSVADRVHFSAYGGDSFPLLTAATAVIEFELGVDRNTGSLTLTNNTLDSVAIAGYSISSDAGSLKPGSWSSVTNNYDAPPGNGSVDPNDAWAILESTVFKLEEEEQPFDDGSTLTAGETVDLGLAWTKSSIEDLSVIIHLADGTTVPASLAYTGGPGGAAFSRSDLNTDGTVTQADWLLFYPNTFSDMSSLTEVQAALLGDLDLDGDNDINDFGLFKLDFEDANGAGSFAAMLSGAQVPEPTGIVTSLLALVGLASTSARFRRRASALVIAAAGAVGLLAAHTASAVAIDFTEFQVDRFPKTAGEPLADWQLTPTTARVAGNASPSVLYGTTSALNKRFVGRITPGTDDDFVGVVLGYQPGNALYSFAPDADYMLIDWKGADQAAVDFQDPVDTFEPHHQFTLGGVAPIGLALSRVTDLPTADELWQHVDSVDNSIGGVTQLARGATLGSSAYPRNNTSFLIDITYTPTNIKVSIDGVEQFNQNGSFPDGRLGMYTFNQSVAVFSNFEEVPLNFTGLTATVDRSNGAVTLQNASGSAVNIDYYELTSVGNSLYSAIGNGTNQWRSLDSVEGGAEGVGWVEAGGANSGAIGELNLTGATVGAGATINLGQAYNELINAEDLVFRFRLADSGLIMQGNVSYIGTAPGLAGDFNGDGMVNLADYTVWRDNLGSTTANLPNDPTPAIVDASDYSAWKGNFGAGSPGSLTTGASQVPEPSSIACLAIGLVLMAGRWTRRAV